VADVTPIQGELQAEIMPVLWRLGEGSVEQVRGALPKRYRSAYNTVQTVLNRLAERGLLTRERRANTIYYRPRVSESDYVSRTIQQALASASTEARQAALAQVFGALNPAEREELQAMAEEIANRRAQR
jgi:predicted transcriptional regulator